MDKATLEFIRLCNAIDAEIATLINKSANHYDTNPDDITWANVGNLREVLNKLQGANAYASMED